MSDFVPKTCVTCPWFAALEQQCRADSPRAFPVPDRAGNMGVLGAWPATREANWCAKHPGNAHPFQRPLHIA